MRLRGDVGDTHEVTEPMKSINDIDEGDIFWIPVK